jgi:hypothetical protein
LLVGGEAFNSYADACGRICNPSSLLMEAGEPDSIGAESDALNDAGKVNYKVRFVVMNGRR